MENKNEEYETFEDCNGDEWEIYNFSNIITEHNDEVEEVIQTGMVSGVFLKRWFNELYDYIDVDDVYYISLYDTEKYNVEYLCIWKFRIEDEDDENTYHVIKFNGSSVFSLETCNFIQFDESDYEETDDESENPEEL
jgi:hypothetical protein